METKLQDNKLGQAHLGISGLGGWLIVVQIGLIGSLILTALQLYLYILPSFDPEIWLILTSTDSEFYHALWGPLIMFELVFSLVFIVFGIYILYNFYQKKSILPKLMIIFYAGNFIFSLVYYILLQQIPYLRLMEDGSSLKALVRSALTCAIWIPYFLRSFRVKYTFIN